MQSVEGWHTIFLGQCRHIGILTLHPRLSNSFHPFRLQDVYIWSFFCYMLVFRGVYCSYDEMGNVRGEIESEDSSHLSSDICQLRL